jgi:phosphate-selective porin OprO/OprP
MQVGGDVTGGAGSSVLSNESSIVNNKAYGLELAAAHGPFKIQGEFTAQDFDAKTPATSGDAKNLVEKTAKADVQAFYVEALYMLTGENYADWYKNGAWGGIKPKNNFEIETGKGRGAWEIGLRYDEFSVDNVTVSGAGSRIQGTQDTSKNGGAKTYTAGIKWQLTPNMRVLANYSHTKFDNAFTAVDTSLTNISKEDLLMVRTQFSF